MEGGKLNFSTSNNGEMFCPFIAKKKHEPIELQNILFSYDTGQYNIIIIVNKLSNLKNVISKHLLLIFTTYQLLIGAIPETLNHPTHKIKQIQTVFRDATGQSYFCASHTFLKPNLT